MKLTAVVRMFALSLVVVGTLAYAQDPHDAAKPQDESKPEVAKPPKDEGKTPRPQEEPKQGKQPEVKPGQDQTKPEQGAARANPGTPDRENNVAPPAQGVPDQHSAVHGQGGRIPDDQFRAHFGREHTVVIRQPVVVEGQPRFQFGGYWFAIVDPWPVGWAYTDDCYVDYVEGEYFLFDLLHPGVRIALIVVS